MTAPTKLQRHLDVIAYLVGRRLPVSVEELMERIPAYAEKWSTEDKKARDAVRRMFERDKDELRAAGIPLKTIKYQFDGNDAEGYIITRHDFYLPYLKLVSTQPKPASTYPAPARVAELEVKAEDAPLALEALRRVIGVPGFPLQSAARSAFRKLAFDLDADAFDKNSAVVVVDTAGTAQLSQHLKILSDALLARKHVSFEYHGMYRGQVTERSVHGYALLFQNGHWYLIGQDLTRADLRVFRVGRMQNVTANKKQPSTPDYMIPQDFSVNNYVGRQPWELGEDEEQPLEVRVYFRFPLSLWAERNNYGELAETHADGATTRTFAVRQVAPFARWVLSLQGDAQILEPEQLRDEVTILARKVAAAHEGDA